jgi:hypothetical protein
MEEKEKVERLICDVIPERINEIKDIIEQKSPEFRRLYDKEGFSLEGGAFSAIQYTERSMSLLWLYGYAGKMSLHAYSSIIIILKSNGSPFDVEKISGLPGQVEANSSFEKIVNETKKLKNAWSSGDFYWPDYIPQPGAHRSADIEDATVYDLTCMGTVFMFLHELRHVIYAVGRDSPKNRHDEEFECDKFAKEIMLSEVCRYSHDSGYLEKNVKSKRLMGIAFALMFILFASKEFGDTKSHPAVYKRWLKIISEVDLEDNDNFWLYFASFAASQLLYSKVPIRPITFSSYKKLCFELVKSLEECSNMCF